MRVLLAGASGLVGRALVGLLQQAGDEVRTLVRHPSASGDRYVWTGRPHSVPPAAISWADAVVSLNGAPLARLPWTKAYRQVIMDSRVAATTALTQAIQAADIPPQVWVSASATGFYGPHGTVDEPFTERSPSGTGFLAGVTRAWEAAALPAAESTRVVRARTGLVLAADGALKPLFTTARLGLGGAMGTGQQHWPWISLRDESRALRFALNCTDLEGPVNLVGPTLATAGQVSRDLAAVLHRPHWFRVPAGVLRTAMGPAADELILASQPVRPLRLLETGFEFKDQTPRGALQQSVRGVGAL
ncbi:MAG: TIGR01777 family oxidoreductase [Bifidobacteriaceae bacterium]|jgi:uncharacterized protein (TIGR01777 family)|nr:TIGR01777 family oxidoreductase [Bifidobacteriaceae bacterium]